MRVHGRYFLTTNSILRNKSCSEKNLFFSFLTLRAPQAQAGVIEPSFYFHSLGRCSCHHANALSQGTRVNGLCIPLLHTHTNSLVLHTALTNRSTVLYVDSHKSDQHSSDNLLNYRQLPPVHRLLLRLWTIRYCGCLSILLYYEGTPRGKTKASFSPHSLHISQCSDLFFGIMHCFSVPCGE